MIWLDPTAIFKRRFEPTEGGYLYYPRAKHGGKLLTQAEHDYVVELYRRWMGTRFVPGLFFWTIIVGCIGLSLVAVATDMSENMFAGATHAFVVVVLAIYLWVYFTPYRLFRNRPDSTPPRTKQEQARAMRYLTPWFVLVWMTLIFGFSAIAGVVATVDSPSVGSAAFTLFLIVGLIQVVRLAVQKYRDRATG